MPSHTVERRSSAGKTFRLTVLSHGGKVDKISLTGDFFIVPEEGLGILEARMMDLAVQGRHDGAGGWLQAAFAAQGIRILGLSSEDLVDALWEALP